MEYPTISVIVPVYNVEKYIGKCIDSILNQTYSDLELLLIDDGSPDESGMICDEYAKRDSRIRVLHKENGGVSSSRNIGVDNARGKWILFVDGDDWVGSEYIQSMFLGNKDADLSMQGYKIIRQCGQDIIHKFDSNLFTYNILEVFCESEYKNIINSPVSKLFKASIIKTYNIRFDNSISYGEDHLFVLEYLKHVKSIYISNTYDYYYYQDDTLSLTRRAISVKLLIAYMILAYKKQMDIVGQFDLNEINAANNAIAWRFYGVYTKLLYDFFSTSPSYEGYCHIVETLKPYCMKKTSLNNKKRWLFRFIENVPLNISYIFIKRLLS